MSKMKFAMAMLAMGGGVGAAVQAQATTVTLDIPMDQSLTQITVVGSTPQFDFGKTDGATFFETDAFANGGAANSALGIKTSTPGLPAPGEAYTNQSYLTGFLGTDFGASGDNTASYIHLTFTSGATTYFGTAYIDSAGELETITYGVPEPDVWALIIAGMALTGGALRTARRRQAAIA